MAKKKTKTSSKKVSLPSIKPSWWGLFILGIAFGISSQHIPEIKQYTDIFFPSESKPHYSYHRASNNQPLSSFEISRIGYSLAYDARHRNPLWVYEHLTPESITGEADRHSLEFKDDDSIPAHLRSTSADYKGQGFDRGHMASAADHRSSQEAMGDTFYMTNMCPQCPELNRGYWAKLEKYVRDLTKTHHDVYAITGPLYLPTTETDGKRYVKYQVIGKNNVAVPTHFFKVIKCGRNVTAYILPNKPIKAETPLEQFQTTVETVEKAAGLILQSSIVP